MVFVLLIYTIFFSYCLLFILFFCFFFFFFSSRRRHTRWTGDWSSDECSSNLFEVRNEIPADLPPARADRKGMEQVFTNLLDNAVKYCGPGTRLSLRARRNGSQLRVEVRSEERRVGKECRCGGSRDQEKQIARE